MAQRRVALRGRTLIGLALSAFLLVALSIVWRRTIGIGESKRLTDLEGQKIQLEGERARLDSDIRDASTRQRLGAAVEHTLGMHVPADNQVVILQRTGNNDRP